MRSDAFSQDTVDYLSQFDVSPQIGFLPAADPLPQLPSPFEPWEELAQNLPKYLVADRVRSATARLPHFPVAALQDHRQLERAMVVLSYIGHAYVWGEADPVSAIPSVLAGPWYEVARRLGRPPVLSYASYALHNWKRFDARRPIELGNIALRQNFLAGVDEEWFILIHVDIEAKAGPALAGLVEAQKGVRANDPAGVQAGLNQVARALEAMYATLYRMPERCDPYIYYQRVRPYIHGWKNNPALPEGLLYEGVTAYGGRPQQFRGETGAQSSIIPCLDAGLGIQHKEGPLLPYLMEMRDYMPPKHRALIEALERGPSVRDFVLARVRANIPLSQVYNSCVQWIERFRSKHLEYAVQYIEKQHESRAANPTRVGTGGTPFVPYLTEHRDETAEHLIETTDEHR